MNRFGALTALLLALSAVSADISGGSKLPKSDLPSGGKFVQHPSEQIVQYYYGGRHSGLFVSWDRGNTWTRLSTFSFRNVFVHPETGKLFAAINYEWLDENKDGYLVQSYSCKVLRSEDGKKWKDITPGRSHIPMVFDVFQDPDDPVRVCFRAHALRTYIYQATDDEYSEWTNYREGQWNMRKIE